MKPWVRVGDRVRSKIEIDERAARAASGFEALGVGRGDVVAVYLRNDFPLLEASLGAGLLGAYVVPVNWHNTAQEARHVLTDSGARVVVIHADLLRAVGEAMPEGAAVIGVQTPDALARAYRVDPDNARVPGGLDEWDTWLAGFPPRMPPYQVAPGAMIYTSGTTGRPKGVRRDPPLPSQAAASARMFHELGGLQGWEDRMDEIVNMVPGPAYHTSPNGFMAGFYNLGANIVLEPRFDAESLLASIEKYRVTHMLAVPTMFVRLLALPEETRRKYDVSSLAFVMHVGSPCPPDVKRAMIDWWGPVIAEHYGSTEVGAVTFCTAAEWLAHPGTVGRAMEGIEVQVLDADGKAVPPGVSGEIACRRTEFADFTYHGDSEKRSRAARGDFVVIGDIGHFDSDGYLYLSGRDSDMIIFGGTNIYPAEIEAQLIMLPGVADCAVFGIPDPVYGEQVCAFVQASPDAELSADGIIEGLKGRLASYKLPRHIQIVDTLPREDTGKIFKRKLREPFWSNAARTI